MLRECLNIAASQVWPQTIQEKAEPRNGKMRDETSLASSTTGANAPGGVFCSLINAPHNPQRIEIRARVTAANAQTVAGDSRKICERWKHNDGPNMTRVVRAQVVA